MEAEDSLNRALELKEGDLAAAAGGKARPSDRLMDLQAEVRVGWSCPHCYASGNDEDTCVCPQCGGPVKRFRKLLCDGKLETMFEY